MLVTGGPASGKTTYLAEHVRGLLERGVPGGDVLVLCASHATAVQMRRLLAQNAGSEAAEVRVATPRQVALEVLGDPEARAHTGRNPRVLSDAETQGFVESLELPETKRERTREIVKFLLREWTELGEDNERFIVCYEEQQLHDGMKEQLRSGGRMLKHELGNVAVNLFRERPDLLQHWQAPYVVVDDYQNLCRASQVLAGMLHGVQIVVAGNKDQVCEVLDPYPYKRGLEEFCENSAAGGFAHVELEKTHLRANPAGFARAFLAGTQTLAGSSVGALFSGQPAGAAFVERYPSFDAEVAGVAGALGRMSPGERADALVVVPNAAWESALADALRERSVEVEVYGTDGELPASSAERTEDIPAVCVGTPAALAGVSRSTAFVMGALDGCYPSARSVDPRDTVVHREYHLAQDERLFYAAVTRATEELHVSYPVREELERARSMGSEVARIYAEGDLRMAQLPASRFLPPSPTGPSRPTTE